MVDEIPRRYHQGKELAKMGFYQFRANKWSDQEDAYIAAQAACCGPDKLNDDVRALNLYCKAAQQGHKASQVEVGRMYSHQNVWGRGTVIPYDPELAYAYFSEAAEEGYEYAKVAKADLRKKLSKKQLKRASDLEADFPDISCAITR